MSLIISINFIEIHLLKKKLNTERPYLSQWRGEFRATVTAKKCYMSHAFSLLKTLLVFKKKNDIKLFNSVNVAKMAG